VLGSLRESDEKKYTIIFFIFVGILGVLLFVYTNCVDDSFKEQVEDAILNGVPTGGSGGAGVSGEVNPLNSSVGFRNFTQLRSTFSVLTGVSSTDGDIRRVYRSVVFQLPQNNDPNSFSASQQVAITSLGAEYCNEAFNSSGLRNALIPNFNFSGGPSNVLDLPGQELVIKRLISAFWVEPFDQLDQFQDEIDELLDLFNDLLDGENLGSSTVTRNSIKSICTAILNQPTCRLLGFLRAGRPFFP